MRYLGREYCCDLLEKSYLCGINNNNSGAGTVQHRVVICLKSLTFVVSITTPEREKGRQTQL